MTKVTQVTQETSGLEVVSSADSLGKCTMEHSGEMKFASKENTVFVCADSAWQNVSAAGKASCAAELLADSSGFKIVCGGDSVGVILNGKDGESCTIIDIGDGPVTQVCGKDSVTLYICGGKIYNKNSNFCYEDSVVALCGGKSYVLSKEFCDVRDGSIYSFTTIGSQVWMAENLNYAYMPDTLSFCYNNSADSCAKYGRLYTWAAAMDTLTTGCGGFNENCSPTAPVRGACPDGWHLPSVAEWRILINFVKGNDSVGYALKSANGWTEHNGKTGGSDAFGFGALPAGYRNGETFDQVLNGANFWSSTWETRVIAYYWSLYYNETDMFFSAYQAINDQYFSVRSYSIRCVKDSN